jgi:hypothetical protein
MTGNLTTSPVQAKELLYRVASSPQFQKSKRLRELLLYLGNRALRDPDCILREQEIGIEVLGRPADYDTSHDTLVRVLVSHLRKRLQEHFANDGRDELFVIEIPKGSYLPMIRPREHPADPAEIVAELPEPGRRRVPARLIWAVLAVVAAGSLIAASVGLLARRTPRPTVEAFWSQLFGNGQPTYLVLSDVTLMEFEMLIGQRVPLSQYEAHEFDRLSALNIADPVRRELARAFVDRVTTAVSDVQVARDFGVLASNRRLPLNIISARDISSSLVASMNTILLGSWRANPWVGLFEDQVNFRTDYQESPPSVRFVNRAPLAGEKPDYPAEWRSTGYCRITFLPNPRHTGNVLLISGSDVISTEAGGRFIASEDSMARLRGMLGVPAGQPLPHFELLLRTRIVNSTVPSFEMVAWRPHSPK